MKSSASFASRRSGHSGPLRTAVWLLAILAAALRAGAAEPAPAPKIQVTVLSFNVLCSFCDPKNYDPWTERLGHFRDILQRHAPDLIGFQELAKRSEADQLLATNPEYKGLFFHDDGPPPRDYPDATIFYKAERFELLDSGVFWLSREPDKKFSTGWAKGQLWRLVQWAKLRDKPSGRVLSFVTTHFDNNKPNQEMSAPLFLERLAPMAAGGPLIVTGDFNSKPDSPAYATLTGGKPFALRNVFDMVPAPNLRTNGEPPAPFDPASRIDHIFAAGAAEFTAKEWSVDLFAYGPKRRFPSDHRAISATIEF